MIQIPQEVKLIINTLNESGHEAYLVGGCVRDVVMGRIPNDWDITTSALPEEVKKAFPKTYDTGLEHGTVTVLVNQENYEVTTYRVEGEYEDYRRPNCVEFVGDIKLDLGRRDFTINAMAYHPLEGFIDPYKGMIDIEKGLLRSVRDPRERFTEDALRILRGVRFSAQLGFAIEESTLEGMLACAHLLEHISKERMRDELMKILLSDRPGKLKDMYKWGLLEYVLVELISCFNTPQNHPHHIYDVGTHTIEAIKHVPQEAVIRLATLLHDIGKPATHTRDEEGIDHFHGHVPMGVTMTKDILRRLRFDNVTIRKVAALVEYHDFHIQEELTRNSIKEVLFDMLLTIQEADARAQNPEKLGPKLKELEETQAIFKDIIEQGECYRLKDLAINGRDLAKLGIKEGKEIGRILQETLQYVMENPQLNDKDYLIDMIKNKI